MARGKVVRFDPVKGYGFISPLGGGEDLFLHVNDLLDEKYLIKPDALVEYIAEQGDRGLKASSVHLVNRSSTDGGDSPSAEVTRRPITPFDVKGSDDEFVDILSQEGFTREVTEALLVVEPSLTGNQIRAVRERMAAMGKRYGWIGD